jgi:hypothetical protein
MDCPDLVGLTNYKIRRLVPRSQDPWDFEIICRLGSICPWGPGLIGCILDKKSKRARLRLQELKFELWQDGDDGQNWVGPVSKLGSACRLMGARRKKTLSDEHKAKLLQGLRKAKGR